MSSQSRSPTPTIVAAAAAAAAMVTMAGTIWLMSDTNYEEDSSSEEFDANGRRKPKSSLLKGTKYSRKRRRRQKQRRVRWKETVSSVTMSPESPASPATPSSQTVPLAPQDSSSASTSASESPSSPLSPPSDSKGKQSDLPATNDGTPTKSQNKSSTSSPTSPTRFSWSTSLPMEELSILQESAANAIINSANGIGRNQQQQDKMNQNQKSLAAAPSTATNTTASSSSMTSNHHPASNGTSNETNTSASSSDNNDHLTTNGHHEHPLGKYPEEETSATPYVRFIQYLKPLRPDAWSEPDIESFLVRGPNYLKDSKKIPSAKAAFCLLTVDLIQHTGQEPYFHPICGHPRERVQQAIKREEEFGSAVKELPPFIFAVNLCLPSSSGTTNTSSATTTTANNNQYYHQVSYFGIEDMDEIENERTPFGKLMKKFIFGDDDSFRDKTFKLIPKIVKGNMLVRRAVGSKPAIIGKKVKQYYFRGDRYFEILVDIGSDSIADRIVKLALGYAKSLVTDICFVLEGTDSETLPERIFGGVTLKYIDFKAKDGDRRMLPLDYSL